MTDIVVVQLRRVGLLKRCAKLAFIPFTNDFQTIRVHDRHQQEYDVVPNLLHFSRLFRRNPVREQWRHLSVSQFGGVQAAIDPHDGFALVRKRFRGFGIDSRARQLLAD